MSNQVACAWIPGRWATLVGKVAGVWCCVALRVHATAASIFQIADPVEFAKIIDTNVATLTTNAVINSGLEGPVWIPSGGGYLVFCDYGSNRLWKLVLPATLSVFLKPPADTLFLGTTLDAHERVIGAEGGTAGLRIVMVTNGTVVPLVSSCDGSNFYSPNDVVVKSDGTIWFTDPGNNGVTYPHAGFAAGFYVYRFNPTNGNQSCAAVITNGVLKPNGLCFSPDESTFYLSDSDTNDHCILAYQVTPSNTLNGRSVFATLTNGHPDGIRCDVDGRVWSSGGDGCYIYARDGHLIGKILLSVKVANLCFGGPQYKTLFMAGDPLVTSIPLLVAGEPSIKRLQIDSDGNGLSLSWPAPSTGFQLQECDPLSGAGNWTNSAGMPLVTNGSNVVVLGPTNASRFYRLILE
jgi:gluconolactonase